jgi:ribonuclease P protein component
MPKVGFPRASRLKTRSDFTAVMGRRLRASDGLLALYMAPNGLPRSRLGVSVGRAAGGAIVRNRIKRLMREAWRTNQALLPRGYDYVLMMAAKGRRSLPTFAEVEASLMGLAGKLAGGRVVQ